ncbi:helix-turn-helix domain-containing protein [Pseudothauera rhizosphaerae]|uniref:Helix-turn-helix domain-containing protein n=1 Tax=Pseudothauera rhizosphaerae TaxID=2565932 RepID=A0A4S4AYW9_9RHOO|nr:helix-turn-helix domain-containing protein [Pseudothauera rhizosphaerae]THF65320.1 helix-turn-helix domain-containing protein [Pseudothauera rhizosphaerae]
MHFGATLRLIRLDSGLSLRDLARRLKVSSTYLSRVEKGLDAVPTPARLSAMARELGVPPTELMDLAHRISPLVADYVERVPEAGSLFLEIAHRGLDAAQLAEVRAFVAERFPPAVGAPAPSGGGLAAILRPDRVVLGLTGSGMDDVLDLAAGRLADACPRVDAAYVAAALHAREAEVSSAIGGGVAVPCAYVAGAEPAAAVIVLDEALAYDTPDGRPLKVVIVLVGPRDDPGRRLVLAQIARLAGRGLADRLAGADSVEAVLRCFERAR